jgi:phosphoadenosine phosphosulfate reductase
MAAAGIQTDIDVERESARLEGASPEERLRFALDAFGDALLYTSSFGAGSGVLLHMWSKVARERPVVFLDTGFLFDETLAYRDRLAKDLGLTVEIVRPAIATADFLWEHGADVYARDPDFCCKTNKIDPLAPHVARARGWVSGLRRDQSDARSAVPVLERTDGGPVRIHPLATMTAAEAKEYMRVHGIPEHPLSARRYLSIGCAPCTRAVADGEGERAGRWAGTGKTECGIHTQLGRKTG